jgi:hypothetical protein
MAYNNTRAVRSDKAVVGQYSNRIMHMRTTYRVLSWVLSMETTRTISFCGIPSVIHTTRGISAATASSIDCAATDGGTKIAL